MSIVIPFTPSSDAQSGFIYCRTPKFTAFYGGRGNGKTTALCIKGHLLSVLFPGNIGLIGRLTYPELRDTTRKEYLEIVRQQNGGTLDHGPLIESFNIAENKLTYRNGSVVLFRHLDNPEGMLSLNLGWFGLDQAEEIPEATYLALEGALRMWGPAAIETWKATHGELLMKEFGKIPTPKEAGFISGNPAPGWVKTKYKEDTKGLYKLFEASSEANEKNLPADYISHMRASYPADWVKRFVDGGWDILGGQVYKEFSQEIQVIAPFEIPRHWTRILSLDHGLTNPTAVLWGAIDEAGNLYIYDEHYQSGLLVSEHARIILQKSAGQPIPRWGSDGAIVWMDPSTQGRQGITGRSVMEEYREHKIFGKPANNEVNAGILRVRQYLMFDPERQNPLTKKFGSPKLFIFSTCENLIGEFKTYVWTATPPGKELNDVEKPKKFRDHALDALRYMIMTFFTESQSEKQKKNNVDEYRQWVNNMMTDEEPSTY